MTNKNLLIIGAGFIGDKLAKRLDDLDYEYKVADLKYGDDIRDREKTDELIKNWAGSKVLLMAAIANLNDFERDPVLGMDVNMGGLINVALACHKYKKRLYYISTCCVYGNTPDLPSTEQARPEPSEVYAAVKLAGEWVIKGLHKSYDMEYVILRIATCYGPGMRAALAPAVFINQIKRNEPITIHGTGKQTRTLTYIDDEVEGIARVIDSDVFNDTFNISTEEEISVTYMSSVIREEMGVPDHPVIKIEDRKGQTFTEQIATGKMRDVRIWKGRYAPSPSKVNGLGWVAKTSFREGIKKTLAWMKENNLEQI
jgi:nucleoside-diphosphate-sugar epimerase